jgi:replicative DNA helicase
MITGLKKNTRSKVMTPQDRANAAMEMYSGYADGTIKRTLFGFPTLDKIGGMAPGSYNILCGETKMGKTTTAKQIADLSAQDGAVLYFCGEMTIPQWNQRDIARILHQPMKHLASPEFVRDHMDEIIKATGQVSEGNIYTICGSVSPEDIYAEACNIENLKLIVVDYLQLLKGVTADYKATSQASSQLSRMAKELEIPMVVLSQLARDNAKKPEEKKPWMQRLKDSGNIENDADLVLNISRDQDAKPGTKAFREATLSVGYHRQGGERMAIPLEFDYNAQIYLEVAR